MAEDNKKEKKDKNGEKILDKTKKVSRSTSRQALALWQSLPREGIFQRRNLVLGLILLSTFYVFYRKQTAPAHEFKVTKESGLTYDFYLVDPEDDIQNDFGQSQYETIADMPRYTEMSILKPFYLVTRFNRLIEGKNYKATLFVKDGKGNVIEHLQKPRTFLSEGKSYWLGWEIKPDYQEHKHGMWKFAVDFTGVGKAKAEFNILAPSSLELVKMKQFDRARQGIFSAFAHYWFGSERQGESMFLTTVVKDKPSDIELNYGEEHQKNEEKWVKTLNKNGSFIEVSDIKTQFFEDHVSKADKLNGVTYRTRAIFSFSVFRFYNKESGWTIWLDLKRPRSDVTAAMGDMWNTMFTMMNPFLRAFGGQESLFKTQPVVRTLRYEAVEQDGNLFVMSDTGDLFTNGLYTGYQHPQLLVPQRPLLFNENRLVQANAKAAKKIIEKGQNPRELLKNLGDSVRASPEATKGQVLRTVSLLKGT